MEIQSASTNDRFPPHPGKIIFRTMWNHSEETKSADEVPEANKFVYYDASHMETSNQLTAVTRVPIVEVEMSSFDAAGHLVEPAKAVRISITEFGPERHELRHSSGRP